MSELNSSYSSTDNWEKKKKKGHITEGEQR